MNMGIEIKKYESTDKQIWDDFISQSKNGTFLFCRDFMEYHSDRFVDFSLLFYLKGKLIAVLPANIDDQTVYSHQGLTYGGLILSTYAKACYVLDIFSLLKEFFSIRNVNKLVYKAIPHIYHKQPCEEDLYALFRNDAKLIGRSISSTIQLDAKIPFSKLRIRMNDKALNNELFIRESNDFSAFWAILENNLAQKHHTKPTHSLQEIAALKTKFPKHIALYEACLPDRVLGGCVLFICDQVVHIQYISASSEGKKTGALDLLFNHIITVLHNAQQYIDFGISTECNGYVLNEGLISQKEGFGARGVVYDTYELEI